MARFFQYFRRTEKQQDMKKLLVIGALAVSFFLTAQSPIGYSSSAKGDYTKLNKTAFDAKYEQKGATLNLPFLMDIPMRLPAKGDEVIAFNKRAPQNLHLKCTPFISGVKIVSVKLNTVTGLPPGLKAYSNKKDNKVKGGGLATLRLLGTPTKKGHFPIVINVTAKAKLGFLPVITACKLSGAYIYVK